MASGGCRAKVSERRYSMKYFPFVVALTCTFVLRKLQVLWHSDGYGSHFNWWDIHFRHTLVFYGECMNDARAGLACFFIDRAFNFRLQAPAFNSQILEKSSSEPQCNE